MRWQRSARRHSRPRLPQCWRRHAPLPPPRRPRPLLRVLPVRSTFPVRSGLPTVKLGGVSEMYVVPLYW